MAEATTFYVRAWRWEILGWTATVADSVLLAPPVDQTIVGTHQLINRGMNTWGRSFRTECFRPDIRWSLPHFIGDFFVFSPASDASVASGV